MPSLYLSIILAINFVGRTFAYNYDPAWEKYNLNTNKEAQHPLEYSGQWEGHTYHPSPNNWRFPFYTLFLDRFVNGDPTNDNINGTVFEHDLTSNQIRNGGDLQGFIDSLDYLQGMGIKVGVASSSSQEHRINSYRESTWPVHLSSMHPGPTTRILLSI